MKRCSLVCSFVIIFALLLSACAADFSPEPAPAPADPAPADYSPALDAWEPILADEAPPPPPAAEPAPQVEYEPSPPLAPSEDAAMVVPSAPAPDMPLSDSGGSPGPPPILTPSDSEGRRLVYTVDMLLQTTEFMQGVRLLYNTISDLNGFIMHEQVHGRDLRHPEDERRASYTFRLYTDNLPEFIVIIEDNFNLMHRQLDASDITAIYEQTGFTLNDLREHERLLQDELDDSELEGSERQDVESALSEVQAFIRSLEAQQSVMDDDIRFSFINVLLLEVVFIEDAPEEEEEEEEEEEVIELTFGERFNQAASRSWGSFVSFGEGLLIVLISILPTLLIIGVLAFVTILIIRFCRKKIKEKQEKKPKQPKSAPANYQGYQNWNYNAPNANYSNPNAPTAGTGNTVGNTVTEKPPENDAR